MSALRHKRTLRTSDAARELSTSINVISDSAPPQFKVEHVALVKGAVRTHRRGRCVHLRVKDRSPVNSTQDIDFFQ